MKLWVNGEETSLEDVRILEVLLQRLEIDPRSPGIAVALNGHVVPRQDFGKTEVKSGDRLEIVRAVQGG